MANTLKESVASLWTTGLVANDLLEGTVKKSRMVCESLLGDKVERGFHNGGCRVLVDSLP